ncbi:hypothetical protein LAZ67_13001264 [Cordylochernes scorpioides]|uniref:Uncharacterized protein n=1 Tax=Cordylochernes scorpioides TaxID=51811 RepID=A0ABY6L3P6_9ARAC|nr:hypothetical protein LAZ67_13001264 [Cordylochernes scorpioides]
MTKCRRTRTTGYEDRTRLGTTVVSKKLLQRYQKCLDRNDLLRSTACAKKRRRRVCSKQTRDAVSRSGCFLPPKLMYFVEDSGRFYQLSVSCPVPAFIFCAEVGFMNGRSCDMVIDPGANVTLMRADAFQKRQPKPDEVRMKPILLQNATGEQAKYTIVHFYSILPYDTSKPINIGWSSLRRCAFSGHNADVASSARPAPSSIGTTVLHRLWVRRPVAGSPTNDTLAILASAKTRIYRYFLGVELRSVQEDPLLVWRRTLSRKCKLLSNLRSRTFHKSDFHGAKDPSDGEVEGKSH